MQSQAYPSGEQGGDYMKMSPGEQEAESPHSQEEGDHKKKSVVGKVKDKAKKLTGKIKGKSKKRKEGQGDNVEGAGGDTSSSSSEDEQGDDTPRYDQEQQQTGYQGAAATPEARHEGAVHGGEHDFQSRELDLGPEKKESGDLLSGGVHGQADPSAPAPGSEWPRSDDEPRSATSEAPSWDETKKRQEEVPAAHGQESSGLSSGLESSGFESKPRGETDSSSLAAGALAGKTEEKIPEGIMKPSASQDEAKPVVDGVDSSGSDLLSSEVVDKSPSDKVDTEVPSDPQLKTSDSQKGWMQRASESVFSVKNALMGSPKASTTDTTSPTAPTGVTEGTGQDSKTWTEKARDAAVSAKDTVSSKLPSSTGPTDVPASGQTTEQTESATGTTPSVTSRAMDSATAVKDTVASKLGYGGTGAQTPQTTPASDVDSTTQSPQSGITQKVMGAKDAVAAKLGYGAGAGTETETGAGEGKNTKLFTPDEHDTALSQKITDMLTLGGGSKNTGASSPQATTPEATPASPGATNQQGKGVMDKVTGVMGSFLGKKQPDEKTSSEATKDTVMSDATA
ncbi:hypothetical protein SELMODRAFT_442807 [Selaginella moellendorffii]|uniref:Uncharacterized protein n=1 Tax=Selaginella moellendorffii TaxID=88036 RepID=D8RWB4_SELML|nr:induced during hyphae development protein 1 [Selaginella moellendorffii]EFJ23640.1 hypothetical protein SELMODRAFT_442807 [Selaginella moellendorffii]|eukprot:XP_002975439.1 induced during hyphae development protein 1 [Selaginella moellendorffii]